MKGVKQNLYSNLQDKINQCIKNVFGADANRIPQQTLNNSPILNATLNEKQVGAISGVKSALGSSNPFSGPNGTVFIAKGLFNGNTSNTVNAINGTFVHELGNILDIKLYPNAPASVYGRHHGDPNATDDTDTGASLEKCVFGSMQYP